MDTYAGYMNKPVVEADKTADTEIADRIMHAMIVKGISLKALAAETGISYSTLRRSFHQARADRRSFTVPQFLKIADALQVRPSALTPESLVTA